MNWWNLFPGVLKSRLPYAALAGVMSVGGLAVALTSRPMDEVREDVREMVVNAVTPEAPKRLAEGAWDLPNIDHERVDFWIDRFRSDPDMREKYEGFVRRSGWYGEMIREKLRERGMPEDLFYLAMIESGVLTYTVVQGEVTVHQADGGSRIIRVGETGRIVAGEWIAEHEGIVHFGENAGSEVVVILASSLLEADEPPAIPVSPAPS